MPSMWRSIVDMLYGRNPLSPVFVKIQYLCNLTVLSEDLIPASFIPTQTTILASLHNNPRALFVHNRIIEMEMEMEIGNGQKKYELGDSNIA